MTFEVAIVGLVIVGMIALLVSDRWPIDQVAILVPVALLLGGVLSPEEAVAGLSHPATVTVGAMLVLGLGLESTGVVAALARWAREARLGGPTVRLFALCVLVAGISPFLNNTAVVVIFLPVFLALADRAGEAASRYLMPLSFAAILGGTVTVIGTSTNLIVWGIAEEHGYRDLSLFSIAPLGLIYLGVGLLYMFTVGRRLLPARPHPPDLSTKYDMRRFITELAVEEDSPAVGRTLEELGWGKEFDLSIVDILRQGRSIAAPGARAEIAMGDTLIVQGDTPELLRLAERMRLATPDELLGGVRAREEMEGEAEERLVELVVAPRSPIAGRTLGSFGFHRRFGAVVIAIQHHGRTLHSRLADRTIYAGDLLLVHGPPTRLARLAEAPGFVPLGEVAAPKTHSKAIVAVGIMVAVVAAAGFGIADILPAAMVGVVAMIFTGCVRLREVYAGIDWSVLVLLAGLIPLGIAMETSGAARLAGEGVANLLGSASPFVTVAAVYLVTSLLTEVMSNNAAAIVLAPIMLLLAGDLGMNPYALLVAVMFGASASFMTPLGYQTNTLIYDPGGYRYSDFLRVGAPLNLLLLVTASIAIPLMWPS